MIDTVKVKFSGRVLDHLPVRKQVVLPSGVRFWHDGEGNCKADVKLPKLLWGHNGRLLPNSRRSMTGLRSTSARLLNSTGTPSASPTTAPHKPPRTRSLKVSSVIDFAWGFARIASATDVAHFAADGKLSLMLGTCHGSTLTRPAATLPSAGRGMPV